MATSQHHNDQFLRRMFDTLYDITPEKIRTTYARIPRRVKLTVVISLATLVLVIAALQLTIYAVGAIQWANRPPLYDRYRSPYALELRTIPMVASVNITEPLPTLDGAAIDEQAAEALEIAQAEALAQAEAALAEAQAESEAVAAAPEGAEEAVAAESAEEVTLTVEDFMPEVDPVAVHFSVLPQIDESYFQIIPALEGYTRTYVYDNRATHPMMNCLLYLEPETADACGFSAEPPYLEAADYMTGDGELIRVVAARYNTPAEAYDATETMKDYNNQVGSMGNFVLVPELPISYFLASADQWRMFTWSNGSWVYMVTSRSHALVEDVVKQFPH